MVGSMIGKRMGHEKEGRCVKNKDSRPPYSLRLRLLDWMTAEDLLWRCHRRFKNLCQCVKDVKN